MTPARAPSASGGDTVCRYENGECCGRALVPLADWQRADEARQAALSRAAELERERDALLLVKGIDVLRASMLVTWLRGGDIPTTVERTRLVLVRQLLEAEAELDKLRENLHE